MEEQIQDKEINSVFMELPKYSKTLKVKFSDDTIKFINFTDISLLVSRTDKIQYLHSIEHIINREYTSNNTLVIKTIECSKLPSVVAPVISEVNKPEIE